VRVAPFLLLAAIACSGCGAAVQQTPPSGNVFVYASNHASEPFTLRDLTITVDGEQSETTRGAALQHPGPEPVPVAMARLSPGPHSLFVRAAARDRAGERVLLLSTSQPLYIDKLPAAITVHVFTPGMGADRRIDLSFDVQGGAVYAPIGAIAPAPTEAAQCARLSPVHAALCRTQQQAQKALVARDLVLSDCVRDKLLALRTLATCSNADAQLATVRARQLEDEVARCPTADMRAGLLVGAW
jgi:hypothetical protein